MCVAFPLNPPRAATKADTVVTSHLPVVSSDEQVEAYYPGTEISGFMPHRGDFATVSTYSFTHCTCLNYMTLVHELE